MNFFRHISALLILRPNFGALVRYFQRYLPRLFQASASPSELNQRHLLLEIAWIGLLVGSTTTFQVIFATRLGASAWQIGLLTSGPALMNLIFTLPLGRWLEGKAYVPTVFWSAATYRFSFVLVALLPLLTLAQPTIWLLISITLVAAIPQAMLVIAFNNMFAEVVPEAQWIGLASMRNAITALTVTLTTLISGQILERLAYPLNYQLVFSIGVLGGVMSTYHLRQIRAGRAAKRQSETTTTLNPPPRGLIKRRYLPRITAAGLARLRQRPRFGLFLGAMGMFHLGQFAIAPLLPLYFIRVANLNDNEIGLLNVGFFIANFFGSVLLVNWLRQMGNRRSLLFGATMMIFFPLVVAQSGGFWALFGAHLGIGLTWGAVATGTQNRVLEQCSEQNRATQLAAYNFVLNGGVLLGPLISSSVAEVNGVVMALWVTAFLRLLGFVGLWRWG